MIYHNHKTINYFILSIILLLNKDKIINNENKGQFKFVWSVCLNDLLLFPFLIYKIYVNIGSQKHKDITPSEIGSSKAEKAQC